MQAGDAPEGGVIRRPAREQHAEQDDQRDDRQPVAAVDVGRRGSSSRGSPRKPRRLASKCTWQNTPKKCMKAGTSAAIMIVV